MLTTKTLTLLAAFVASGSAQLFMRSPVPYGYESESDIDDEYWGAPLQGGIKPCNFGFTGDTRIYTHNVIPLGEEQDLKLQGQAAYGGGSCQFSLSTDIPPTEESVWKVFYTVEGGCPAGEDPPPQKFTIPNGIAPGNYTLAWTWVPQTIQFPFMYCAAITAVDSEIEKPTVEESKQRETGLLDRSDFPEMWLGSPHYPDTCYKMGDNDFQYPEPGQNVDRLGDPEMLSGELYCPEG